MFSSLCSTIRAGFSTVVAAPDSSPSGCIESASLLNPDAVSRILLRGRLGIGGELDKAILETARRRKTELYQGVIYGIVPIYVTSVCRESCLYCNYRVSNRGTELERVRLSDDEVEREVRYLADTKGLRVFELVYATDPHMRIDTMCRHVERLRGLVEEYGSGDVGINAEALDTREYRLLRSAGLSFAVLWQETYDECRYRALHPGRTKKSDFRYRVDAPERMIVAGLRHIGMGILSGLSDWRWDWAMLIHHEKYLWKAYGVHPAILGIPRLKSAAGALTQKSPYVPTRLEFLAAVSLHNIVLPRTLAFVSTREDWALCLQLADGGGCLFTFNCSTIPGGYSLGRRGYQFPTASYDAPHFVKRIRQAGLTPIFDWAFPGDSVTGPLQKISANACIAKF